MLFCGLRIRRNGRNIDEEIYTFTGHVSFLAGCGSSTPKERTIYDDMVDQYYAQEIVAKNVKNYEGNTPTREEVHVHRNYGEYNGTYVIAFEADKTNVWGGWFEDVMTVTVDGVDMHFPACREPLCWNDHVFIRSEKLS